MMEFWRGRRVLVTGHTGFKGTWLLLLLHRLDAITAGYALAAETEPSLFELCAPWKGRAGTIADIRDLRSLRKAFADFDPEISIHMAAQSLVRRSYADPIGTFETNVDGTLNFLSALSSAPSCRVALIVTSDKVYANDGRGRRFSEDDRLGGGDPYSASKACAEIATASFAASFPGRAKIATARAGNVIGGGDWTEDRLVPDLVRAIVSGRQAELRYPQAVRPWQFVLDTLRGYLMFIERLWHEADAMPQALNFGPLDETPVTVRELAERFGESMGEGRDTWRPAAGQHPPEAPILRLDPSRANSLLSWRPILGSEDVIDWTARWYSGWRAGKSARALAESQLADFLALCERAPASADG